MALPHRPNIMGVEYLESHALYSTLGYFFHPSIIIGSI
jgi:hypothetical protein